MKIVEILLFFTKCSVAINPLGNLLSTDRNFKFPILEKIPGSVRHQYMTAVNFYDVVPMLNSKTFYGCEIYI